MAENDTSILIRNSKLPALLGVSNKTVRRWQEEPDFPKPQRYGPGMVMYLREDIEEWVRNRNKPKWSSSKATEVDPDVLDSVITDFVDAAYDAADGLPVSGVEMMLNRIRLCVATIEMKLRHRTNE